MLSIQKLFINLCLSKSFLINKGAYSWFMNSFRCTDVLVYNEISTSQKSFPVVYLISLSSHWTRKQSIVCHHLFRLL